MGININDFIFRLRKCGLKRDKVYHLFCDECGNDRGYNAKYLSKALCNSCASKKKLAFIPKEELTLRGKYAVSFVKKRVFSEERKHKISLANSGKKRSFEQHKLNSAQKQGIDVSQWKDFSYNREDVKRSKYKSERFCKKAYELSDFTCNLCSRRGGKLHAHHLDNWKQFKEKRYDLTNIVCLCINCHRAFHKKFGTRNNTKEQYLLFKEFYVVK